MDIVDLAAHRQTKEIEDLKNTLDLLDKQIATLNAEPQSSATTGLLIKVLQEKTKMQRALQKAQKDAGLDTPLSDEDRAERDAVYDELKDKLRTFIKEQDLHYVAATECWFVRNGYTDPDLPPWMPQSENGLKRLNNDLRDKLIWTLFDDIMMGNDAGDTKRKFRACTYSFRPTSPDVLNMLEAEFCLPIEPEPGWANGWLFEALLWNLSGEDPAGQEHLEKVFLSKWQHPENYMLPCISFHDPDGGSGKSLLVARLLSTLFGEHLVADNLSFDDLTNRFNEHLVGKALLFVNEAVEEKSDDNALKRQLHSKTVWCEPKGVKKFRVDNTALLIVSGNGDTGSVRIANASTDRRFSILKPKRPLNDLVGEIMGISPAEAREWMIATGQYILSNPQEVGKWLHSLILKHGDVPTVAAYHGQAYQTLVQSQQPFYEQVFEAVFKDDLISDPLIVTGSLPLQGYIKQSTLFEFYIEMNRKINHAHGAMKNRTFYAKLDSWLAREGLPIRAVKKVKMRDGETGSVTTADIYILDSVDALRKGAMIGNDHLWYTEDSHGRRTWAVNVI